MYQVWDISVESPISNPLPEWQRKTTFVKVQQEQLTEVWIMK